MHSVTKVTLKMEFQNFPVEIEIMNDSDTVAGEGVIEVIKRYQLAGFSAPTRFTSNKSTDNIGKIGEIKTAPAYNAETKMWGYTAILSDASEFKWNDFSRTAFRVGDVIRVVKNDRGFKTGEVLDPDSKEVKEYHAGQPNKNEADDQPF